MALGAVHSRLRESWRGDHWASGTLASSTMTRATSFPDQPQDQIPADPRDCCVPTLLPPPVLGTSTATPFLVVIKEWGWHGREQSFLEVGRREGQGPVPEGLSDAAQSAVYQQPAGRSIMLHCSGVEGQ